MHTFILLANQLLSIDLNTAGPVEGGNRLGVPSGVHGKPRGHSGEVMARRM